MHLNLRFPLTLTLALCGLSILDVGCGVGAVPEDVTTDGAVGQTPDELSGLKLMVPISATASANDGNLPKNVLDNNLATRWSAHGPGVEITGDLGAVRRVGGVAIAWYAGAQRKATYSVSLSADGTTFTQVFHGLSSGKTVNLELVTFPIADARYIRVTGDGNTLNGWTSITELRAALAATPAVDGGSTVPPPAPDSGSTLPPPPPAPDSGTATPPPAVDQPGPANTGVPAGTTLTDYTGPTVITTPGTVIDSVRLAGTLTISADNVTVRRSDIEHVLVRLASHVVVEDVTSHGIAVSGSTFVSVLRSNICCGNDSMDVTSDTGRAQDILIQDNYVHDPSPSPMAHYDGIQVRGVDRLVIRHNNFDLGAWQSTYNSSIYLENANGGDNDVVVDSNWLNGGGFALFVSAVNLRVDNNRWGRAYHWGACRNNGPLFEKSGNVWDDTGAAFIPCP